MQSHPVCIDCLQIQPHYQGLIAPTHFKPCMFYKIKEKTKIDLFNKINSTNISGMPPDTIELCGDMYVLDIPWLFSGGRCSHV